MNKISISNIGIVHGLFVEYDAGEHSDSLVFGDISNNEESILKLINLLQGYNDVSLESLRDIIEDFVCDQGIPKSNKRNGTMLANKKVC